MSYFFRVAEPGPAKRKSGMIGVMPQSEAATVGMSPYEDLPVGAGGACVDRVLVRKAQQWTIEPISVVRDSVENGQ